MKLKIPKLTKLENTGSVGYNSNPDFHVEDPNGLLTESTFNIQYPPGYSPDSDNPPKDSSTTHEDAINAIVVGCKLAQERGAYSFEEARAIMNAIDRLNEL